MVQTVKNKVVLVRLSKTFDQHENCRKKLLGTIALRVIIERPNVNISGVFVKIGGRSGKRRGFHQKIGARGMFDDAQLVLQDHRSVINASRRSSKSITEIIENHGEVNDDVKKEWQNGQTMFVLPTNIMKRK